MDLYFSDVFSVSEDSLEEYGAFNVSLVVDLPLFVDPFLLFNSANAQYQALHERILSYLRFLRSAAEQRPLSDARLRNLFCFREVEQTWLGFSMEGNRGRGLGLKFGRALAENLTTLFSDFGDEQITRSSHLEKLTLICDGVGRDMISDFTTNLIKKFLCDYTQTFAERHIAPEKTGMFAVQRVDFNYTTRIWMPANYRLPRFDGDFVLLTPSDILTKDDTWINKEDFEREYTEIPVSIPDQELRDRIDSYFQSVLPQDYQKSDEAKAIRQTTLRFPQLIDYFIRRKEDRGDEAESRSIEKVNDSICLYVEQFGLFVQKLHDETEFYREPLTSHEAAREKVMFLKDVIENKGGYRLFYYKGNPIEREADLQILYRLVWHHTIFDVSREVNDGRGPADFKISRGSLDKTLVEMKLASNTHLKRNLEKQAEIYMKASDAKAALKVVLFFTAEQRQRVEAILDELKLKECRDIILIDARDDNKPAASKA